MKALTPAALARATGLFAYSALPSPRPTLNSPGLPFRPQPRDPSDSRFLSRLSAIGHSRLRHYPAGSPRVHAETGSCSYRLAVRLQLLPTTPLGGAVTFGYKVTTYSDRDFHPADKASSRTHWMAGTSPAMTKPGVVATSPQRLQFTRQRVGPLRDVAGPETHDEIAASGKALDHPCEIGRLCERDHLAMTMRAQAEHEVIAIDAFDRRLAGRIDLRDDDRIGVVEAGAELLEQRLQTGIAMRLHHGDDLAVGRFARGLQHGRDLHRMVAVIVDHRDAVPFPGPSEAPLHPTEARDRLADGIIGKSELVRDRNRGGGVERVVLSCHRQGESGDLMRHIGLAVAEHDLEARTAAHRHQIDQARVGLRILAIGDDAAILDLADQSLHHGVIDAHHGETVERHVLDEIAERVLHRFEGLEVIEMLGIDIGDDGDIGRQFQEGAVAFVGLHHHPVACAEPRIGAIGIDDAAVDHGRYHDHVGAIDVFGLVTDRNLDPLVAQARDIAAFGRIRALDRVAEIVQDLGDAAHADAADPDEVDGSDFARQSHERFLDVFPTPRVKSARREDTGCPAFERPDKTKMALRRFKSRRLSPPDRPAARRHRAVRRCARPRPSPSTARARRRAPRSPPPTDLTKTRLAQSATRRRPSPARRHWRTGPDRSRPAAAPGSTGDRSRRVPPRCPRRIARRSDGSRRAAPAGR